MNRITSIVFIVAVAIACAGFVAHAGTNNGTTIHVEADEHNQTRGYVGFNITTFREGRYLIESVVQGTDGLYRDRKIVMTAESTGDPWVLFDIVTEDDASEVWWGYVDESTVVVEVNGEHFLEIAVDENGNGEVTDLNDELETGFAAMHLFISMLDTNLGAQIAARGAVPVFQPAPGPGPVLQVPPCWNPCNPGVCCVGPGAICTNCCACCSTGCGGGAAEARCKFRCQVQLTIPPVPGPPPPAGQGAPAVPCDCS